MEKINMETNEEEKARSSYPEHQALTRQEEMRLIHEKEIAEKAREAQGKSCQHEP